MENQSKRPLNKKLIAGVAALVVVVAALLAVYFFTRPAATAGDKTITATVVANGSEEAFTIQTDEEYLRGALESIQLIEGDESEYGLYVKTVDGVTKDYDTDGQYWSFYIDGEYAMSGVDSTDIVAGSSYEFRVENA